MTAYIYELEPEHAPWHWALAFDYNEPMVQGIKANIPSRQRKWVPDQRQWWFKAEAEPAMLRLAERFCGGVLHIQADGHLVPAVPAELVSAYHTLHLLPSAPDELVKVAYKTLAKRAHPDKGGNVVAMQKINMAYALLEVASHSQFST